MMDVYNWFWSEKFWLPEGSTWKDLENDSERDIYLPQAKDINWSLPIGVLLLLVRYIFELHIITPLGFWLGVKEKKQIAANLNPVLEKYCEQNGHVNNNNIQVFYVHGV